MPNATPARMCLMFDGTAEEAARFYVTTFPRSSLDGTTYAPSASLSDSGREVLLVAFTILGIPCIAVNGGPHFTHGEAFSFQVVTDTQEETDHYWNAIVGNGGTESRCGWCTDRWGVSWQITPRVLSDAIAEGGAEAKRAFDAMLGMKKIDIAVIEAARRGEDRAKA